MADSPDTNTDGPVGVTIKLNGSAMPDSALLQSVRVVRELNRIPEATFTVLAGGLQIEHFTELDSGDFALGTEVEINAFYGDGDEQLLFEGLILSTRARLDGRRGLRMDLTCRDKAMRLTEIRTSKPYVSMKDSEIMTAIIEDATLTSDVTATTQETSMQLRIGATDWDFLRLLADRNGYVLAVAEGTITAKTPDTSVPPVLTVTYGADIIEFDVSVDAHRMIAEAKASAWSEQNQEVAVGNCNSIPDAALGNTTMSDIAAVLGDRVLTGATSREFSEAELTGFSESRMARSSLAAVRGNVKFQGSGKIKPMDMLEIVAVGDRFSGNGYVTSVEQTIETGSWTTQVRLGLPQDWTSDVAGMAAPAAEALATPIHGVQIGKVLKIARDEEGKQRIQVKLPMIGDPAAEVWARFASPYASVEAGFQFLPEVNDEVLVAFLNADPSAPVIVGSLHNNTAMRPVEAVEDNFIKTIVTPEALKIVFDDEKKIITVETPGGHVLTMDDDASAFSMEDMNGNSIVMDGSGIALKSDKDITITATGNVTAEATQDATVNGSNVTCEGQIGFTGKGGATAELSAGGQTTVEGAMVMIN